MDAINFYDGYDLANERKSETELGDYVLFKDSTIISNMMLSANTDQNAAYVRQYCGTYEDVHHPVVNSTNAACCKPFKSIPLDHSIPTHNGTYPWPLRHELGVSLPSDDTNSVMDTSRIGPYDIVELRATSLHAVRGNRETSRIIGVAAGENLHNVYRVLMASLCQREDRARLVFHAWILPDGSAYGNISRGREPNTISKSLGNDREVYLNQLPIYLGYQLQLVFGKCVYNVVVQDLLIGLNDEQDLIWTPRVCEGSYGEAVPFDLCYSPHLFRSKSPDQSPTIKKKDVSIKIEAEEPNDMEAKTKSEDCDSQLCKEMSYALSPTAGGQVPYVEPQYQTTKYLSEAELDEINRNLSRMRFIRQYSQIKPLLRKNRPEELNAATTVNEAYMTGETTANDAITTDDKIPTGDLCIDTDITAVEGGTGKCTSFDSTANSMSFPDCSFPIARRYPVVADTVLQRATDMQLTYFNAKIHAPDPPRSFPRCRVSRRHTIAATDSKKPHDVSIQDSSASVDALTENVLTLSPSPAKQC